MVVGWGGEEQETNKSSWERSPGQGPGQEGPETGRQSWTTRSQRVSVRCRQTQGHQNQGWVLGCRKSQGTGAPSSWFSPGGPQQYLLQKMWTRSR